jgi:hypothetical protein
MTYSLKGKHVSGERSKTPSVRARSRRSARLSVHREVGQKRQSNQEARNFKEAIIHMFPRDFQTILQALVTFACLYEFIQTRDTIWLLTAYAMANGSSSLPVVKTLLPNHKVSSQKENEAP